EILERQLAEAFVAQDAGVVDEDIDPAPALNYALDYRRDLRRIGNVGRIGDGRAPGGLDFGDDFLGRRRSSGTSDAVDRAACIVDDHLCAARREAERVAAAEPVAGTGNDGDAI